MSNACIMCRLYLFAIESTVISQLNFTASQKMLVFNRWNITSHNDVGKLYELSHDHNSSISSQAITATY